MPASSRAGPGPARSGRQPRTGGPPPGAGGQRGRLPKSGPKGVPDDWACGCGGGLERGALALGFLLLVQKTAGGQIEIVIIEIEPPADNGPKMGCTDYDENGQLICKETYGPNDPNKPCEL